MVATASIACVVALPLAKAVTSLGDSHPARVLISVSFCSCCGVITAGAGGAAGLFISLRTFIAGICWLSFTEHHFHTHPISRADHPTHTFVQSNGVLQ